MKSPWIRFVAQFVLAIMLSCIGGTSDAAPFDEIIAFDQPDGTRIQLRGKGDEFYAVFETLDGYTVVFNRASLRYEYAVLSADGKSLLASGSPVGKGNPKKLGFAKHLRMSPDAIKQQVSARRNEWDRHTGVSEAWQNLKTLRHAMEAANGAQMSPPAQPTLGTKVALCLLIDFDDAPASIPQSEIASYCNGDSYTGFGNNGSVKKYFQDVSNNRLTYSNVVTIYIRIPNSLHPKSYYNDPARDCGDAGNELIRDAVMIMKALPNYTTEILPTFQSLTTNSYNRVNFLNVFYAGGNSGVWSFGLWPHSWSLYQVGAIELSPGGKQLFRYQITNLGSSPKLGTFCHENGHMLCGFPDIYDYDMDSVGGAGAFCLMNSGNFSYNPAQFCAYLKYAAGWATITELNSNSLMNVWITASPGGAFNQFYRYKKPGVSTEYFLVENRQKAWRDSNLPASGIAIWHIDEYGQRDDQSLATNSSHNNYEVTLVQADNQWHFENYVNTGDSNDLYYNTNSTATYLNRFSDTTSPNAHWWDGKPSGIDLRHFSAPDSTMHFAVETTNIAPPAIDPLPPVTPGTESIICWSSSGPGSPAPDVQPSLSASLPTQSNVAGVVPLAAQSKGPQPKRSEPFVVGDMAQAFAATTADSSVNLGPVTPESEPASGPEPIWYGFFGELFEGSFPGTNWHLSGDPTWGASNFQVYSGTRSGWCCASRWNDGSYTNNMHASMIYGPFSLEGAASAKVVFRYMIDSEEGHDFLHWAASVDGTLFFGDSTSGWQYWTTHTFDLNYVNGIGNLCGRPQVWVAFFFTSDASNCSRMGAFLDGIQFEKDVDFPDLRATGFQFQANAVAEADPFWVRTVVTNSGLIAAPATHAKLYLSADNDDNVANDYYVGEQPVGPLVAGGSASIQWNFTMPDLGMQSYPVWPVVVVDDRFEVLESDERNTFTSDVEFFAADRVMLYYVECATNSQFTLPRTSGWTQMPCVMFGSLTPGQTYWYRVKAKHNQYESPWSAVVFSQQEPGPLLSVTPASLDFGTIPVGDVAERIFYVTNVGGGTITGFVSTQPPFAVLPPTNYSLGAAQGRVVLVQYHPTISGNHTGAVIFSGGGGSTNQVSGAARVQPSFTSYGLLSDRRFQLTISGATGQEYDIDFSSNLTTWLTLATVTNVSGNVQWIHAGATNSPHGFYRSVAH